MTYSQQLNSPWSERGEREGKGVGKKMGAVLSLQKNNKLIAGVANWSAPCLDTAAAQKPVRKTFWVRRNSLFN